MKIELRKMRAGSPKDKSTASYISSLQHRNLLTTYINEDGYVEYETDEFEEYKKHIKIGRPTKNGVKYKND